MAPLIAFAIALVLTPLAGRAGRAAGLVDRPGDPLKIHTRPVPVLGGLAVVVATFAAAALAGRWPGAAVAVAATIVLAAGIVDDRRPLATALRLLFQLGAAAIVAVAAFDATLPAALGLVLLVLATTNAVNIVDGQDGLAGGLAAIAALGLALLLQEAPAAQETLALALAGSLAAFLVWNRPPARIFLGNGGAYAVGVVLAVLAGMVVAEEGARGILPALLCPGVFLFDLAFTVVRRLGSRKLALGDRLHSYDLLSVELGSRGGATLAFWALGAVLALAAVAIDSMPVGPGLAVAAAVVGAGALWARRLWVRQLATTRLPRAAGAPGASWPSAPAAPRR
jgi:UDP-GlcNAc:undecaprenyl-phosphate GlcNAc-1-phosphate transferase